MKNVLRKAKRKAKNVLKKTVLKTVYDRMAELEDKVKKLEKENKQLKSGNGSKVKEQSPAYKRKVKEMVKKVSAQMGWDPEETLAKFEDAEARTGCTPKEYYLYRIYDMSAEEQEKVLVAAIQKPLQKKYNVDKDFISILYDKEKTNQYFAEYIRRPWCVNTKVTYKKFAKVFQNTDCIIYKPLAGNRGKGIEKFNIDADNIEEVYETLKTYPDGVVEKYVVQHPDMLELCPSSVNTIRFVTFSSNTRPVTEDGKYMDIAYTSLRVGGGSSVVDNFHSGGMVCHVDEKTGIVITDAADMECRVFEKHPVTGVVFKGFQIPCFAEAVQMVTEAIRKNRIEGYIGWDIAIAEDGPILIEVNDRPGIVLLSTPYAEQKVGMKHVLAKYL